jgi:CDP-diacylglycerol--serine O-phosphatidyltransferase
MPLVWFTFLYTLAIAFLMVSRLPVFSGKRLGRRVAPELVMPVVVVAVLFFALLLSYPWTVLTVGTVVYLGCLPLGWAAHRDYLRKDALALEARAPGQSAATAGPSPPGPAMHLDDDIDDERPTRLN